MIGCKRVKKYWIVTEDRSIYSIDTNIHVLSSISISMCSYETLYWCNLDISFIINTIIDMICSKLTYHCIFKYCYEKSILIKHINHGLYQRYSYPPSHTLLQHSFPHPLLWYSYPLSPTTTTNLVTSLVMTRPHIYWFMHIMWIYRTINTHWFSFTSNL